MQYMFRFRWGAQFVLTFHLTSSLPISVFTRRLLQVRIIGCLTFGCSSAFIIGSYSLPIVANMQSSIDQILDLLEQSINWPTINYYCNYWNNWPTTSYSLLEQICFGADEGQMALSGVESIDTLPSVECRNINWSLCSTLGVARYVCVWSCGPWAFVLFCSCTAPILWTIQSIAQQEKPKESVDCKPALVAGIERWAFATATAA